MIDQHDQCLYLFMLYVVLQYEYVGTQMVYTWVPIAADASITIMLYALQLSSSS
jgi:hypothetical protein